ncbi:NRT1 PTR FAMILY -like [Chlorella sorokiniana]|uniref:NRT1 PTR FAMILY-like n=1 Tax=Chlorella sorokiniana TaxID=3076 RepID=A0A2P6TVQ4_CHLSO|nr:NRT1 PTR FAMILY -like [Chlorella sorokiniana]|eukprot:PRW58143.1 NRT1 PTR FAMILY -like [Chlorella sorokiniana]
MSPEQPKSPFESEQEARPAAPADSKLELGDAGGKLADADTSASEDEALPLLKSPMVTRAPFILVNEMCERLAYYGIATNIITYLTGKLGQSNSSSAAAVNAWSGTCYVTPLLGAFIADAYWGRYWVILVFSLIYMGGLGMLSASAGDSSLHPPAGEAATGSQLGFFWAAMYLIAVGTGGIKPCVSTFGADQFDDSKPAEAKLIPRFFNWFYASINVGAIVAATVIVNIQTNVSWFVGFLIPTVAFAVATTVFVSGTRLYRRMPPAGSPFTRMARVIAGAFAHCKAKVPEDATQLHEVEGEMSVVPGQVKLGRSPEYKWLEKACTVTKPAGSPDRWLVTLTEVEELKCIVRLLPVMLTLIVYNSVYAQMTTLFILQGEGMDTQLGSLNVAPATVSVLDSISVIIWVVLYDMVIAPFFQRRGRPISQLVRIGIGYAVACLAMVVAAIVEICRLQVVKDNNLQDSDPTAPGAPVVPMSVWIQIPQYALIGCSEVFSMVGAYDLFYSQAPDGMRSTCMALQLLAGALGSYLAAALVSIVQVISNGSWVPDNVNDGHMDYFFWMMAVLMALTLVVYVFIARSFRYKQITHDTVDPEAMGLSPDGRGALAFSIGVVRSMSADIQDGMPRQDSVERHYKLDGSLSGPALSLARRRSARSGPVVLTAVVEEPADKDIADTKQEAPAL